MKLTFYNHYGVGDLFESREFVLEWMRLARVKTARYAHRSLPGFFEDLPQIRSVEMEPFMDMRAPWFKDGDHLYVNTWIGRDSDYVVNPGIGCTVKGLYRMHNDMLADAGLGQLPRSVVEYIPDINYARVELGGLDQRLRTGVFNGTRLVLLCNGKTGSGQAPNFDMGPMLDRVPYRKDVRYIFTDKSAGLVNEVRSRGDVFFTEDLIQPTFVRFGAYGPCDFNAISYLSRFCKIIVGRCSGPQMGANVLQNWMDSRKKLVCFTHHRNGACFVLNPEALGLKMQVVWSPAADAIFAGKLLEELLAKEP